MRKTEIEETTMTDINKIENGPMLKSVSGQSWRRSGSCCGFI